MTEDDIDAEEIEFQRLYGPWQPLSPDQVSDLLGDFAPPWWLGGGWAIEAFTGVPRPHEDVDVVIFRRDVPSLRSALAGRFHLWSAGSGALRPLNDRFPDLHPDAGQVWVRQHALAPWVADVIVNDDLKGSWVNKRWAEHVASFEEVTWVADTGIRYANPEIVLHYKARLNRPKDNLDLAVTWPLLSAGQQTWLLEALRATEPGHPWLRELS